MKMDRRIKTGSSLLPVLVVILTTLCAIAIVYFVFRQPSSEQSRTTPPIDAEMQQQLVGHQPPGTLKSATPSDKKSEVAGGSPMEDSLSSPLSPSDSPLDANASSTAEGTSGIAVSDKSGQELAPSPASCPDLANRLNDFFSYLDEQEYLREHGLSGHSLPHVRSMASRLFDSPPVIISETDDLFTILQNTAHIYRVVGKADLFLLKDIITREAPRLEHDFSMLYDWAINDSCRTESKLELPLPVDGLYEYSSFLLGTLGGQSYLFRREAPVRVLATYYSIRIIDLANDRKQNRYGIALTQPIAALIDEITTVTSLEGRDEYLRELQRIARKQPPASK